MTNSAMAISRFDRVRAKWDNPAVGRGQRVGWMLLFMLADLLVGTAWFFATRHSKSHVVALVLLTVLYWAVVVGAAHLVVGLKHAGLTWRGSLLALLILAPPYSLVLLQLSAWGSAKVSASVVVGAFCAAMTAGITEEVVYRGVGMRILGGLQRPWFSVTVTAVFFGAIHFNNLLLGALLGKHIPLMGVIGQVIVTFALGFVFAVARAISGTIVPIIVLHFLMDFTPPAVVEASYQDGPIPILPFLLVPVYAVIYWWWLRRRKRTVAASGVTSELSATTAAADGEMATVGHDRTAGSE